MKLKKTYILIISELVLLFSLFSSASASTVSPIDSISAKGDYATKSIITKLNWSYTNPSPGGWTMDFLTFGYNLDNTGWVNSYPSGTRFDTRFPASGVYDINIPTSYGTHYVQFSVCMFGSSGGRIGYVCYTYSPVRVNVPSFVSPFPSFTLPPVTTILLNGSVQNITVANADTPFTLRVNSTNNPTSCYKSFVPYPGYSYDANTLYNCNDYYSSVVITPRELGFTSVGVNYISFKGVNSSLFPSRSVTGSITIAPPPTHGVCGTSNSQSFYTAPTYGFCQAGSATSVSGSGPWMWSCNGLNGGTNASCSANYNNANPTILISPLSANITLGQSVPISSATTDLNQDIVEHNLNIKNAISNWINNVTGSSLFSPISTHSLSYLFTPVTSGTYYLKSMARDTRNSWVYSSTSTIVVTNPMVNGQVNPAYDNGYFATVPTGTLCTQGNLSGGVSGDGSPSNPWVWMCLGVSGGSNDAGVAYYQPATPAIITLTGSPLSIAKGGNVSLVWNIKDPNVLCKLVATSTIFVPSVSCGVSCVNAHISEANSLTSLLATSNSDNNYPTSVSGARSMASSLRLIAPGETKAVGKKTLRNINYNTDFILQCSNSSSDVNAKKIRLQVVSSQEI